jgi:hypothetical protein
MIQRIIGFFFLLITFAFTASAQVYYPFPVDSAEWSVDDQTTNWSPIPPSTFHYTKHYRIRHDSLVNNTLYHAVYASSDSVYNTASETLKCFIREDASWKVYCRYADYPTHQDTTEFLLYDFAASLGDTIVTRCCSGSQPSQLVVSGFDSVIVGNAYRKKTELYAAGPSGPSTFSWVEGVGDIENGILHPEVPALDWWATLLCFSENNIIQWQNGMGSCYIVTAINEINHNSKLSIYPNPFNTTATLSLEGNSSALDVFMYDITGRAVYHTSTGNKEIVLDRTMLGSGMYFIKVFSGPELLGIEKVMIE